MVRKFTGCDVCDVRTEAEERVEQGLISVRYELGIKKKIEHRLFSAKYELRQTGHLRIEHIIQHSRWCWA